MAATFEHVKFGKDNSVAGYESGDKSLPALLVIQEWWGVNNEIKELAAKVAATGPYRVLIPDLYKGKVGVDAEEASHLMGHLDWKLAVEELTQAVQYLRDTGAKKVGVIGFCMGGALSFAAAQHAAVDCAVPCYGTPNPQICQVEQIKVPVQAHFGELDHHKGFSDPETAKATVDKIKAAGGNAELFLYQGCDHAFLNATIPPAGPELIKKAKFQMPKEEAVQLAFQRISEFLKAQLYA